MTPPLWIAPPLAAVQALIERSTRKSQYEFHKDFGIFITLQSIQARARRTTAPKIPLRKVRK